MFPKICGNACLEPLKFKFHNVSLSISTNVFQLDFNPLQFSHPWEDRKQTKNGTYDAFRNNCIILPVSCFKPKTSLEQLSRDKKMTLVPSDNSSQIPKSDNSSQATIRPILERRKFVPNIKRCNLSSI